jgi:lysophospholipase L1-like esterase
MGRFASRALLGVASVAVTALLLEGALRVHEAWSRRRGEAPWAVFDTHLGYRLNRDHPGVNQHGLRDHEVPPKSQRLRVLMLGDSLAFEGEDVDDTWVGHLRARLREDPELREAEVINASVPGYTNYQELRYLELHGLELEPDVVGVGFVWNDLFHFLQRFQLEDGRIVPRFEPTPEVLGEDADAVRSLRNHSLLLRWLDRRLAVLGWNPSALPGRYGRFAFEQRIDLRAAWQDEPWRDIEVQLRALVRLGQRERFRTFLVMFPVADQYDAADLARDRDYVLLPQRRLSALCERLSIPCLDLYPLLDPAKHLMPDGIHLTPEGRRHVGAEVSRFLLSKPTFLMGRGGEAR